MQKFADYPQILLASIYRTSTQGRTATFLFLCTVIKYLYYSLVCKVSVSAISQQARTNAWSSGHWPGGIAGSNSAGGIDVCLL
jgi:hypothetical protein